MYINKRSNFEFMVFLSVWKQKVLSLLLVIEKRLHRWVVKMFPPSDGEASSAWMF